jgi:hypothetical protein
MKLKAINYFHSANDCQRRKEDGEILPSLNSASGECQAKTVEINFDVQSVNLSPSFAILLYLLLLLLLIAHEKKMKKLRKKFFN